MNAERKRIGIVMNVRVLRSERRKSEELYCRVLVIDPLGNAGNGHGNAVGYHNRHMRSFRLSYGALHSSMFEDGAVGTLTLGRRRYRVYPEHGKHLEYRELQLTEEELAIHLSRILPLV
ncbi:MAG: hypothetical protein HYW25_01985 [Candidatus Aenigmarchaeota archaeon]|nr:hypothetical protein [Candidatus Aenigmarchaeota archaeon]